MRPLGSRVAPWFGLRDWFGLRGGFSPRGWFSPRGVWLPLLVEVAAVAALGFGGDPTARPLRTLLLLAVAALALWALVRATRRRPWGLAGVLALAALLRLLLLPLPPELSRDVWRYLWEGRVAAAGGNPYVTAPDAPSLVGLRDEGWARVHHRDVPTVYPPLPLAMSACRRTSILRKSAR